MWGRPFLVTGQDTATIAEGIDAYLAAGPDDVDDIARSMLDHLDPGFADRVAPDDSGTLPSPDNLARGIRGHVDILRETVAAHRAGRSELTVGGDHFEPAALIERDLGKVVLDFAAVRAALAALPADPALDTDRRKLDEALADAAHRGLPFAEATEIYSGIMGIMN